MPGSSTSAWSSVNEANAIIVHGTMCLIRRAAMDMAGGWNGDTICEDTDLGLAIIEHGWLTHYTNHRYGHGLLPDTYEAFKKQRHRWAYGGFQIVKKQLAAFFFPARADCRRTSGANLRWAGSTGSAPKAWACWSRSSI